MRPKCLGKPDKKPLFARIAIEHRSRLTFQRRKISFIGNRDTRQVTNILALRKRTIYSDARQNFEIIVLPY